MIQNLRSACTSGFSRLVVLESGLRLESGLESSFGGLGLGLGLGRLENQVLYQVHTKTDDGNGLFSK